jgi:hypothetical protein
MAAAVASSTLNMAQAWAAGPQRASGNHIDQARQGCRRPCRGRSLIWGRITGTEIPGASAEMALRRWDQSRCGSTRRRQIARSDHRSQVHKPRTIHGLRAVYSSEA